MGNVIKIDDGFKTYDIVNQNDKVLGQFSFNPSDTDIVKRYNKAVENFQTVFEEIGKVQDESNIEEVINKLDEKTYEFIDSIFNAEVSQNFFSIMGPFSPLASGQLFVESVIDAIGQAIQAETGERVKKINKKIQKHTSKYHR